MNLDARWNRLRAKVSEEHRNRADGLLKASQILGVSVAKLVELSEEEWWELSGAISLGNLHGEDLPACQLSALTEEQLERIIDGERPSVVVGRVAL